jgi:hypothetical protein
VSLGRPTLREELHELISGLALPGPKRGKRLGRRLLGLRVRHGTELHREVTEPCPDGLARIPAEGCYGFVEVSHKASIAFSRRLLRSPPNRRY